MTMLRSVGRSMVLEIGIVTGEAPQLKVTTGCDATAARKAASVQLCAVPVPTLGATPTVRAAATGGVHTCPATGGGGAGAGAGGGADVPPTWHCLPMPNAGSLPKKALLH